MVDVPDADDVRHAVESLAAALRRALADDPPGQGDAEAVMRLAGTLVTVTDELTWCRDAALALGRSHPDQHRRTPWGRLQVATGVSDSTLIERLQRWRRRERTGGTR